jgi:hypothetical protein
MMVKYATRGMRFCLCLGARSRSTSTTTQMRRGTARSRPEHVNDNLVVLVSVLPPTNGAVTPAKDNSSQVLNTKSLPFFLLYIRNVHGLADIIGAVKK